MYNRQHLRGLKHLHISKTDWTSHLQWVMTFLEVNIFSVIKPTVCVPALFFTVNSVYSLLLHFPSVIQCLLETSHGHFQGREATNEGISLCYLNQKWPWRGFFFSFPSVSEARRRRVDSSSWRTSTPVLFLPSLLWNCLFRIYTVWSKVCRASTPSRCFCELDWAAEAKEGNSPCFKADSDGTEHAEVRLE